MTAIALRPLTIGELLDTSFQLYRRHFVALATIVVVCQSVPLLLQVFAETAGSVALQGLAALASIVLGLVLGSIATAATVFVISESYLGRTLTAGDALARATPYIGRLIFATILFMLAVGVGLVLFIVPGIIMACGLALTWPAAVLEPVPGAPAAMSRSWELTKGYRWRMFWLFVIVFILIALPMMAAAVLAGMLGGLAGLLGLGESAAVVALIGAVLGVIAQVLVFPLYYCALTVAYYDLRVRKEGFDLEVLASTVSAA